MPNKLQERAVKTGLIEIKTTATPLALNHSGKTEKLLRVDYKHSYTSIRPVITTSYID